MDFFDLSKEFKPIYLKGGQTKGFVQEYDGDYDEDDDDDDDEDDDYDDDNHDNNGNNDDEYQYCDAFGNKNTQSQKRKGNNYVQEYLKKWEEECEMYETENSILSISEGVGGIELTSLGTYPDVHEVDKEEKTYVYKRYFTNKPPINNNLVINDYKSKILSMIKVNEVIIVTGPTGCGKTTQVPQFILDHHAERNLHCNVVVTQPRRIAAISIAKRVCEERDWALGTVCGYKVGLLDQTSEDTRLTYVTVGVFLQTLIGCKNLNKYTHVILDEVHERDHNMDFILLIVRRLLWTTSRNVKVILMSATADVAKFANYFHKRLMGKLCPAPVISITRNTNFLVQIHYLDEMFSLGELPDIIFEEPGISETAIMTCIKLIKQFDRLDKNEENKKSVLVFLPGIYEIEEMFNKLKDSKIYSSGAVEYKWFPIPLHSSITVEEQAMAFRPAPSGFRKIILSTNVAESSVTVPDVMFVIDFCLTKVLVTDSHSNFTSLQLCWASKANCVQRAGRAGRLMEGRVYRMVYREIYEKFNEHCIPDMLRCPLEKVVLQSKLLHIGSPKAVLALALDPPDLSNIEKTILILKEVGGLLRTVDGEVSPHDGDITFLGRLMALLPVDIYITRLIALGHLFSCLESCIIIGAALSLKSVFSSPFQARLKSYNSKLDWADGSCSDCIAFLNVYDVWRMNHTNGYYKRSAGGGEVIWAKRHFIQLRALKEVHILVQELTQRLKKNNIERSMGLGSVLWSEIQKPFILKFVIAGAFYPNYFARGERGGQVSEELAVRTLGGRDPFTTVYLQNYPSGQPPELYSHLIKEKLSECKEEMKICYDNSSKVFIEFRKQYYQGGLSGTPFSSEVPGKILMAVYRAVKIRQTMKYVDIKVLPPEQAKKMAEKLGLEKKPDAFLGHLQSDLCAKNTLFQTMVPGIDVSFIRLAITHKIDPGHFWAASKDEVTDRYLREVFELLNSVNPKLEIYSKTPEVGEMCAAPYKDEDGVWMYRARIDSILDKKSKAFVQVFFIDYGNTERLPVSDLRKYAPDLLPVIGKIPALCFECVLTRVRPSLVKDPSGKWCEAAHKKFEKLTDNAELIGSIYSVVGSVVSVVLYKVCDDGHTSRQMNINQQLIKEGFAEEIEESFLSKSNNEIRSEKQLDSDQKDAYNTLQIHENWFNSPFQPFNLQGCNLTLKLSGPFSPLEMKVFSLAQCGLSKHVSISPSSVNSVLLDSDPQDPHERLLVAAQVSQNQSGSNIILHHTTLLPNIHGLAALVPFIFAPTVELRVSKHRTHYTGILCGLGVDSNKKPIFPDHDMEIVFDVEFSFDDFSDINKLRFYMSLLLSGDGFDKSQMFTEPDIINFQNNIKTCLLKLLDRPRPSKELEFPKTEFKWGLNKKNVICNEKSEGYHRNMVFPPHPGVSVTPDPNEKHKLKVHAEKLRSMVENNVQLDSTILCQLCFLILPDLKALRLHLRTNSHKKREQKLIDSEERLSLL